MSQSLCYRIHKDLLLVKVLTFLSVLALVMAAPLCADVVPINPEDPPEVTLPPAEAEKLSSLLHLNYQIAFSDSSPNGETILALSSPDGIVFLNLRTGEKTPLDVSFFDSLNITENRWKDNTTMVSVDLDWTSSATVQVLKETNSETLEVSVTPLDLPGYVLSLSPMGNKVLLIRSVAAQKQSVPPVKDLSLVTPPYVEVRHRPQLKPQGQPEFDYEKLFTAVKTTDEVELVVYDLNSNEEQYLMSLESDSVLRSWSWSPLENRLAIIGGLIPSYDREAPPGLESPDVQDSLGNLPPLDNPFFTSNELHLFSLSRWAPFARTLKPTLEDGAVFGWVSWDPTGMIFIAQMFAPSVPEGRSYPSFANWNSSFYRFYLATGQLVTQVDEPEINAAFGLAHCLSPFEAVIHVPDGLTFSLYRYNWLSGRLRRLPTPIGTIHQSFQAGWRREMVYSFSSYDQPLELFRLGIDRGEPVQLTFDNEALKEAGAVQAEPVHFTLANGEQRAGYYLLASDTTDSWGTKPLVVWQQGGPTSTMTVGWGNNVESPFNILPHFGFPMLVVPLPGRDGFGPEFLDALADEANFGQIDIAQQAEIVDQLVDQGIVSWSRVGITGCSYGGYFASQSVTQPDLPYGAAVTQCSLLDLFDEWDNGYTAYISYLMGRTPLDDEAEYSADSPLARGDQVLTPTLIFAGTEDFLPSEISRDFHDRIESAGTPTRFYEFLNEYHGLVWSSSQFVANQAQIEWFRQYLGP